VDKPSNDYDAIVVAVNHNSYLGLTEQDFKAILAKDGILIDINGAFRGKIKELTYWSL
jgi:UDP-N-acetyl-D-galactosamine dehydrogenase